MSAHAVPVALVTGASKRIGRGIAEALHAAGYAVCIHYHNSVEEAAALAAAFNAQRPDSAAVAHADLGTTTTEDHLFQRCAGLLEACHTRWGRCDVLVNSASAYYPTPLLLPQGESGSPRGIVVESAAADIFGSNAVAPYYLTKAFAQRVADTAVGQRGPNYVIINMVDSMTNQPLLGFTAYTMAKAALEGLTRAAALELAPLSIRVNGVAPGLAVLPVGMPVEEQEVYRTKVPLYQREATTAEIGESVLFLCSEKAKYITGSFLNVDGGWSLTRS